MEAFDDGFPLATNCCMDVARALAQERAEPKNGTGLDPGCQERIRNKPFYSLLMAIGHLILEAFGILIVVCNHGKHRSTAIAADIAREATNATF